jgi:DNA-binding transcriptional ArsR family regulator
MPASADTAAFRAISHPIRRDILETLARGERTVGDLVRRFDVTQPAVSQHLEILREAGLVSARAAGRRRVYALDPAPLREVFDWAARFETFWSERLDRLGDVLDREANRAR